MIDRPAWLARARTPDQYRVRVLLLRCGCGRALYMTVLPRDWGQQFCVCCDENVARCYCPRVPEEAA